MSNDQDIRDCVVFLCAERDKFVGTAFIVGITSESKRYNFPFLVTAKHVAKKLGNKPFFIRMNNKQGLCDYVPVKEKTWFFHPSDETADIALLSLDFDASVYNFKMIPLDMFVSDDTLQTGIISVGLEVIIAGLFIFATGSKRNQPILRTGNIAMLSDEPIPTEYGDIEAYLIEARSIGGISGSPVFTYSIKNRRMYLLGMIRGHWSIRPETINEVFPIPDDRGVNLGIAVISPAKKILETLNHPELIKLRREADS